MHGSVVWHRLQGNAKLHFHAKFEVSISNSKKVVDKRIFFEWNFVNNCVSMVTKMQNFTNLSLLHVSLCQPTLPCQIWSFYLKEQESYWQKNVFEWNFENKCVSMVTKMQNFTNLSLLHDSPCQTILPCQIWSFHLK